MDKSDSQKLLRKQVIDEHPEQLSVSISDSELTVVLESGGYEAAYTAKEARKLASDILMSYHQRGRGKNIVTTADYINDLADVVDNKIPLQKVKQKWDHGGEVGTGQKYTIVTDTTQDPIISFGSKTEAMRFCDDWNSRSSWVIEYHLKVADERVKIWNLTEDEGEMVAEMLREEISRLICTEDTPDWEISVEYTDIPAPDMEERMFHAGIRNKNKQQERYRYQIYYAMDGKGINTLTQQPVTNKLRVRIDRHRGRILEAMSKIPKRLGLYIGKSDADLEWLNLGSVLTPDHDFP